MYLGDLMEKAESGQFSILSFLLQRVSDDRQGCNGGNRIFKSNPNQICHPTQ